MPSHNLLLQDPSAAPATMTWPTSSLKGSSKVLLGFQMYSWVAGFGSGTRLQTCCSEFLTWLAYLDPKAETAERVVRVAQVAERKLKKHGSLPC